MLFVFVVCSLCVARCVPFVVCLGGVARWSLFVAVFMFVLYC